MITRATGSLAVFSWAFTLLALFDLFAESMNDGLVEFAAPRAVGLVDAFAPIS